MLTLVANNFMIHACRDCRYDCYIHKSQPWLWQNQVPIWSGIRRFFLELGLHRWLPAPCSLLSLCICELSLTRFSQVGEGFCNAEKVFFRISCLRWVAVCSWCCKGRCRLLLEGHNWEGLHDRLRKLHLNAPGWQSPELFLCQQRMRSEKKGILCYFPCLEIDCGVCPVHDTLYRNMLCFLNRSSMC